MQTKLTFKQSIMVGLLAGILAMVINVILFFIFHAAGVITDTIFIQPNTPLSAIQIVISSLLPSLIASMVFFLFEKYSKNGFKIFSIVSILLLILSFLNPFLEIPNVTIGYAIALNFMHIVVAGALLYFINKSVKTKA